MSRLHAIAGLLSLGLLSTSCAEDAQKTQWSLVGAYDATATLEAGGVPLAGYVWSPAPGMRDSCGPAKGPLGLGTFEVEAVGNGLTPALALVLHYGGPGKPEPLTPSTLTVAMVDPDNMESAERRIDLEPALVPRRLAMEVTVPPVQSRRDKEAFEQVRQLVWTQLSIELCLEHKVGRGWLGSDAARVREAFMLDRPKGERGAGEDRRYFVGQRDPVPALLGPPDACAVTEPGSGTSGDVDGLSGAGATRMVASDIWGASLRRCSSRDPRRPATALSEPEQLDLLSSTPWGSLLWEPPPPRHIRVDIAKDQTGLETFDLQEVALDGSEETTRSLLDDRRLLFPKSVEDAGSTDLTDVLALVPHRYPLVRDGASPLDDPDEPGSGWYTVLLIPDWQLVQAISTLYTGSPPRRGSGPHNGVTWVLAHPDHLSVQVAPGAEKLPADLAVDVDAAAGEWPDLLATAIGREWKGLRDWGYTVGLLHGRQPVFLPAAEAPNWEVAQLAQRANLQGGFLAAFAVFLLIIGVGARRVRDLWTPIPKERADYWPGVGVDEAVPESSMDAPSTTMSGEA